jgi:hypothetical protein
LAWPDVSNPTRSMIAARMRDGMIMLLMDCFCRFRERFAHLGRTPYFMARMERFESLSGLSGSCEGR